MIHPLGSALIVLCAVLALACAVFYAVWFRWWTSDEGRHLFRFMGVVAGVLTLWTVMMLIGTAPWVLRPASGLEWVRLVTFAPIAWILGDRLRLLVKAKVDEHRERREIAREER